MLFVMLGMSISCEGFYIEAVGNWVAMLRILIITFINLKDNEIFYFANFIDENPYVL